MIKPAAVFVQWLARRKGPYPAVLSPRAERQSYQAIKTDVIENDSVMHTTARQDTQCALNA